MFLQTVFYSHQTCRIKSNGFGDHSSSSSYFLCVNQLEKYNNTPNQAGESFRVQLVSSWDGHSSQSFP